MSAVMRAKFYCSQVEGSDDKWEGEPYENLCFQPVVGDGSKENESFSKYTPNGLLQMTVTNPNLIGQIKIGDVFYLDFTKVEK